MCAGMVTIIPIKITSGMESVEGLDLSSLNALCGDESPADQPTNSSTMYPDLSDFNSE